MNISYTSSIESLVVYKLTAAKGPSSLQRTQATSFMISLYHFFLACVLLSVRDHMIPYDALCKTYSCICMLHHNSHTIAQIDTIQV